MHMPVSNPYLGHDTEGPAEAVAIDMSNLPMHPNLTSSSHADQAIARNVDDPLSDAMEGPESGPFRNQHERPRPIARVQDENLVDTQAEPLEAPSLNTTSDYHTAEYHGHKSKREAENLPTDKKSMGATETHVRADTDIGRSPGEPKTWTSKHPYVFSEWFTNPPKQDPWETLKESINKYDDHMCDAWNGELDTIFTFTGLFSAVVTAFCIESFQSLYQSPADTTNTFLIMISQQLANSSTPAASIAMLEGFTPKSHDVYINVLYFVSLALALSVSSICILGKQWIREYQKDISVSACDTIRLRQVRFESLQASRVPEIMAALPVILLGALILFFAGLLVQLWHADNIVTAVAVTIIVTLTVLLVIVTTLVPAFISTKPGSSCFSPFRSPQAWIILTLYHHLHAWLRKAFPHKNPQTHEYPQTHKHPQTFSNWAEFDRDFLNKEKSMDSVREVLRWVHAKLGNSSAKIEQALFRCLQSDYLPKVLIGARFQLNLDVLTSVEDKSQVEGFDGIYYQHSQRNNWKQGQIDNPLGRHQAELLIRSIHNAVDYYERHDFQETWKYIIKSCISLSEYHGFNDSGSDQDVIQYRHMFQDQVALFFKRIFTISPPDNCNPAIPMEWAHVLLFLFHACQKYSSPVALQVLNDVINHSIPAWMRKHQSASLLCTFGNIACNNIHWSEQPAIRLLSELDKVMAEWGLRQGIRQRWEDDYAKKWSDIQKRFRPIRDSPPHVGDIPGQGPLESAAFPFPK